MMSLGLPSNSERLSCATQKHFVGSVEGEHYSVTQDVELLSSEILPILILSLYNL